MTIGVDVSRAFQKQKTGVQWYVFHLMNALVDQDSRNEYRLYIDTEPIGTVREEVRSKLIKLAWPFRHFWTQGRLSLEMLFAPPDVLVVPASAMPLIHPKKTVVVVHDVGFLRYPHYRSWFAIAYLRWSTRYALKHAWRIVVVSEWTRQEIVKYYRCTADKIRVIPNGVDQNFYHRTDTSISEKALQSLSIRSPFFLTIGRLDPRKNISMLIRSFTEFSRKHPNYSLVIAGPEGHRSHEDVAAIEGAIARGVSIVYLKWINEEDKRALLSSCTAFIFPTIYEGFGIPLIEAQLCQAPVIASSLEVLKEVSGMHAIFFDPHESQQLIEAMTRISVDTAFVQKLRQRGFENAQRFSWEKTAQRMDAVCRGI